MKPKHQRLLFISFSIVFLCAAVLFSLRAFRDNMVFFYTPSDLAAAAEPGRIIRIGGLVEEGSVRGTPQGRTEFIITDRAAKINVTYTGMLPNLFREGQGVVAEGRLTAPDRFEARTILAKHDENYMPADVAEALKRAGRWKGAP